MHLYAINLSIPSLAHQRALNLKRKGSGDLVYSELFGRNAILTKYVMDNCKRLHGWLCARTLQLGHYLANLESDQT